MKKTFCTAGIVAGAIIVIFGFIVLSLDTGYSGLESTSFGGDFYTYSYRATRVAAQNVCDLAEIVKKGFSFILIALGATDICFFGSKLPEKAEKKINVAEDIGTNIKTEPIPEQSAETPFSAE